MAFVGRVYSRNLGFGFTLDFGLLANYCGALERGRVRRINNIIISVADSRD